MIARHPRLRVVGCHLGSNEEHLDQLAKSLDALPNFAVDVASRVRYLDRGDPEMVRQFVTKYQDRIIYATDFTPGQDEARGATSLISTHEREWNFFAVTAEGSLALTEVVLKKIFQDNAARWIPVITLNRCVTAPERASTPGGRRGTWSSAPTTRDRCGDCSCRCEANRRS
jgi:predicted TIM-barrel fold metal-dependent hydrolase